MVLRELMGGYPKTSSSEMEFTRKTCCRHPCSILVQSILNYHLHGCTESSGAWTDSLVPHIGRVGVQPKMNVLECKYINLSNLFKWMYCQTLITDFEYADDMCLINDSMDELEEMLQNLVESLVRWVSPSVHWRQRTWQLVRSNNDKQLGKFIYNLHKIQSSLLMSSSTWEALSCQIVDWIERSIHESWRHSRVLGVWAKSYGTSKDKDENEAKDVQGCSFTNLVICYWDMGPSSWALEVVTEFCNAANIETVETVVKRRMMRWLGHIVRRMQNAYPRNCWYADWKWASRQS